MGSTHPYHPGDQMKAAVLEEYEAPLAIRDMDTPTAGSEDVVIEMEACGICRSDLHGWQGSFPLGNVPGHEPAGTVIEIGEAVENIAVGDQIVAPFNVVCGRCRMCRDGTSNLCENARYYGFSEEVGGAFASHLRIPDADYNSVQIPDGISPVEMAGLGCRFITAFHGIAHRSAIAAGDWVAVHGCGGVGLSAINVASALGGNVIGVDLFDEKLEMASNLGAVATVNAETTEDVPAVIRDITDGGADISVDALGVEATFANSIACLDKLGQHVQIGELPPDAPDTVDLPLNDLLYSEIEMTTAAGFPPHRYSEIFDLMAEGKIQPQELVTNTVALTEVSDRLEAMADFQTRGVEVITSFD